MALQATKAVENPDGPGLGNTINQARYHPCMAIEERTSWLTLPNALTLLRVLLIVPFATAAAASDDNIALAIFVAAGITDLLDGALARRLGQGSKWGRLLDPLADKLLTGVAFITLAVRDGRALPLWLASAVILRDIAILGGSLLIYASRRNSGFKPSIFGKLNTFIELGVVTWFLASAALPSILSALPALYTLLLLSLVVSIVDYLRAGLRMLRA